MCIQNTNIKSSIKVYYFLPYEYFEDDIKNGWIKLVSPEKTNDNKEHNTINNKENRLTCFAELDINIAFISFCKFPFIKKMWEMYADGNKGICLEFDIPLQKIERSYDSNTQKPITTHYQLSTIDNTNGTINLQLMNLSMYDIIYTDDPIEAKIGIIANKTGQNELLTQKRLIAKEKKWKYEQEKRINIYKIYAINRNNMFFVKTYNKYITKVILGIKCPIEEWRTQHMLKQYQATNGYKEIPKVVRAQFSADDYKVVVPD